MNLHKTIPGLALVLLFLALVFVAPPVFAQNNNRCAGIVTDHEGNPMKGVNITFYDNKEERFNMPVKTNKKGKYAHNTLAPNSSSGWQIVAEMEGWKIVQITALSISATGDRLTDETYMVGYSQEGLHAVRVPAQSRTDVTSKANCEVDFIMAPDDQFNVVFARMKAERDGADPDAAAAAVEGAGVPGEAADAPAAAEVSSLDQARNAVTMGDWASAVTAAAVAVEEDPEDGEASYLYGQALLKTENVAAAEPALKRALEIDPERVGVNFHLGMLYIEKGRLMQAIPYFEAESELVPDNLSVMQNLGKLYAETDQNDKAVEVLEALIELEPDNVGTYGTLANVYKEMGQEDKEREVYERMGAADPTGMAFYNLGTMMFNNSEMEAAAAAYEQAIKQAPDNALALRQLAMTYVNLARFKDAVDTLEKYLKVEPKGPKADEARGLLADLKPLI